MLLYMLSKVTHMPPTVTSITACHREGSMYCLNTEFCQTSFSIIAMVEQAADLWSSTVQQQHQQLQAKTRLQTTFQHDNPQPSKRPTKTSLAHPTFSDLGPAGALLPTEEATLKLHIMHRLEVNPTLCIQR